MNKSTCFCCQANDPFIDELEFIEVKNINLTVYAVQQTNVLDKYRLLPQCNLNEPDKMITGIRVFLVKPDKKGYTSMDSLVFQYAIASEHGLLFPADSLYHHGLPVYKEFPISDYTVGYRCEYNKRKNKFLLEIAHCNVDATFQEQECVNSFTPVVTSLIFQQYLQYF